ncbi:MAG: DUF2975 domain-containing protein [Christensenellaceae bacterium]|nr:DUF2975 domain-containing protein [Christensenellaceae bacterium]
MKISKISSTIILVFSLIILIVLVGLLFMIPYICNSPVLAEKYTDGSNAALRIYLYIADLAAIWFMIQLFRIMQSVFRETPFIPQNVRALRHLSLSCFIAFSDFAIMIISYGNYDRFGMLICTLILFFGSLSAFVLSNVFHLAVSYKQENDLTV